MNPINHLETSAGDRLSPPPLASNTLFEGLDRKGVRDLEAVCEEAYVPGGQTLFREGEAGDSLYAVLSGRLLISRAQRGGDEILGEVGPGQTVGEMAVLTGNTRSATVQAIRDTELVKLSRTEFERFTERHPYQMKQITRLIAQRLVRKTPVTTIGNGLRSIAVVPCSKDVPLSEFVERLCSIFSGIASTLHLTSHRFKSAVGRAGSESSQASAACRKIAALIGDLERTYRYVIYESDPRHSAWTSCCVRQADCVLLVGWVGSIPTIGELETHGVLRGEGQPKVRTELVLLDRQDQQPTTGRDGWPVGQHLDAHHYVALDSKADLERLARLLTGRAIGLVLSGGGARGFAHIGVIRALQESSVPVDYIGGTSMGALIGAQLALGWDYHTMVHANKEAWVDFKPWKDYTLPIMGCLSGRKMTKMLRDMFEDVRVEGLRVNYFCVSTNLSRAETVVQREGPLWKCLRASVSIPGICPPVLSNGELLVDGGVLNNLPVDVMRKVCQGRVIGVYASEGERFASDTPNLDTISGWTLLLNRLNPFTAKRDMPNILSILVRTSMLNSFRSLQQTKKEADLYIRPPVDQFGRFEWKAFDKLVELGYSSAQKEIEGWQAVGAPGLPGE